MVHEHGSEDFVLLLAVGHQVDWIQVKVLNHVFDSFETLQISGHIYIAYIQFTLIRHCSSETIIYQIILS